MKTTIVKIAGTLFIFAALSLTLYANLDSFKSTNITIDKTMTESSINLLKSELSQKGIDLSISELSYNNNDHIEKLEGRVEFSFFSGSFSTDHLKKLTIQKNLLGIKIIVQAEE